MSEAFLTGNRVYLRPPRESDIDSGWARWFNDPKVNRYLRHGVFPNTAERQREHFSQLQIDMATRKRLQLAIVDRDSDELAGMVSLNAINWLHRHAEIAIVIGEERFRSAGNGLEAMALLLHHGFSKLNLNRIWAGQHVGLRRWKEALVDHLGFREEGLLREAFLRDGSYHDVVVIGVLQREWETLIEASEGFEGLIGRLPG